MRNRFRSLLFLLLLVCVAAGAISPTVYAQEYKPWECPECPPEQIDRNTGRLREKSSPGLPEQIQIMGRRMTGLMQFLQDAVVREFTDWAMSFSRYLAGGLWLFFFLKVFRESGGKGANLYWWFPRLGVCMGLLLSSIMLINEMVDIGKGIAVGPSNRASACTFYDRMQANFTESYSLIAQNQFKVRVPGQSEPYAVPAVSGDGMFLGVVYDQQSTARDFNNNLKDTTWLLPRLYAWLGVCRGILEFADFVLMIIAAVTIMAAKIFAPFAVVLAVDRDMAKRISYPFLYGVVVLTIVWPTVSYFIRGVAYMFGNVAMALGDSAPAYVWNEATLQAFRDASAQPVYTVAFACFTMTISAIALFFSPVIAYQISMGRLYEGISNAVSTAAGMVSGFALEAATSIRGSLLNQDAARIQAQAGFEGETKRAAGERQAADLSVKGRQFAAEANIEGNRFSQLANTYASQSTQIGSINADKAYQIAANNEQRDFAVGNQLTSFVREKEDNRINYQQQYEGSGGDLLAAGYNTVGGVIEGIPRLGKSVGSVVGGLGSGFNTLIHLEAGHKAYTEREQNINNFMDGMTQNQEAYAEHMNTITETKATSMINTVNEATTQIVGGINTSSNMQLAGVRQEAEMGLQANQARYDAQTQAAGITRGASIEAARLHVEEQLTRAIGGKLARDIENAMTLRY